jgi:demethylmenaquinone methyltransferase/2-methoxy-6-polyprenyl-1,4-benzoquinol methylase
MSLRDGIPVDVRPERLFPSLGRDYERSSALLSMGWEAGWRRRLVQVFDPREGGLYLDVATGTGLVARAVRAKAACRVVGLDLVEGMLRYAAASSGIHWVRGRAERLPFADATFNGLTFTYLFRYVDDPVATLRELARVVHPGGRIAMLEFARPRSSLVRLGWRLYTRMALPVIGSLVSRDWREVGGFLGPSIDRFYERYDLEQIWADAGMVGTRIETLGLGAAAVVVGQVPT